MAVITIKKIRYKKETGKDSPSEMAHTSPVSSPHRKIYNKYDGTNDQQLPPHYFEVSFILHSIKGSQFSTQAACVSINGHSFMHFPRFTKKKLRLYEIGNQILVPVDEVVRFAVGVITPDSDNPLPEKNLNKMNIKKNKSDNVRPNKTGYLHAFARYTISHLERPIVHNLTMETIGGLYTISATLYVAPSWGNGCPSPSKTPQMLKSRPQKRRAQTQLYNVKNKKKKNEDENENRPKTHLTKKKPIENEGQKEDDKTQQNDEKTLQFQTEPDADKVV